MHLILYRALAVGVIGVVVALWFFEAADPMRQHLLVGVALTMLALLPLQTWLVQRGATERVLLSVFYGLDVLAASLLVFATGGANSPFALLLGLIIIASGAHAWRALPQLMTLLACSGYLLASYGEVWNGVQTLTDQLALHILLQSSVLLLVGGVMAYISRRHASLRASTDLAVHQHHKLKDLHDKVMGAMLEGVVLLDESLAVNDMNAAASRMLRGGRFAALLAMPDLVRYFSAPGAAFSGEFHDEGMVLRVAVARLSRQSDAAWLMTLVDISNIRRLEQQLVQQEKMAMLGQMAAMLAHEIRNPIQTMTQGLELMEMNHASRDSVQEILRDEMARLKRLVMTMLNYSQPLQPKPQATWMPGLLRQAVDQLEIERPGEIEIHCSCNELMLDGDHLRLALDNLLSNALSNRSIATPIEVRLDAEGEDWVLSVCNEGNIPDAVRDRLFEPFVTGRSAGFGLGLATVKQVCLANGWQVLVDSGEGRTCFFICGPRTTRES